MLACRCRDLADANMERRPGGRVAGAPGIAVKGPDLQVVAHHSRQEGGLGQLSGGDVKHRGCGLLRTGDDEMPAIGSPVESHS